jgi:hypothetical protein
MKRDGHSDVLIRTGVKGTEAGRVSVLDGECRMGSSGEAEQEERRGWLVACYDGAVLCTMIPPSAISEPITGRGFSLGINNFLIFAELKQAV